MTIPQLRAKYLEVLGEPSRSGNRDFLFKRVAWRVQSLAEGGLSERAKRRAEELARDSDIRTTVPRSPVGSTAMATRTVTRTAPTAHDRLPIPGTVLTRHQTCWLVLPSAGRVSSTCQLRLNQRSSVGVVVPDCACRRRASYSWLAIVEPPDWTRTKRFQAS